MKYISSTPRYMQGTIKRFPVAVYADGVTKIKETYPEPDKVVLSFEKVTTGYGNNVSSEAEEGVPNEVLAVYNTVFPIGHIIGAKNEINRFLSDYDKTTIITDKTPLVVGQVVMKGKEQVKIEWLSTTPNRVGAGYMISNNTPVLLDFPKEHCRIIS